MLTALSIAASKLRWAPEPAEEFPSPFAAVCILRIRTEAAEGLHEGESVRTMSNDFSVKKTELILMHSWLLHLYNVTLETKYLLCVLIKSKFLDCQYVNI